MSKTNSLTGVQTFDQGFLSNEIEDSYDSHLDLNQFCTVDDELEGAPGDVRRINVYAAAGTAEDVAEGQGNVGTISVNLTEKEYRIKTAQAQFQYSDEALLRDPISVQTGATQTGVAIFNKVNADIMGEMKKAVLLVTPTAFNFDAVVDAVSLMDIPDANAPAIEVQGKVLPTLWAITNKKGIANARKDMTDQLVYDPDLAWAKGYVGTVAGVALYYKQDLADDIMYVGSRKGVTVFNKSGVEVEAVTKNQRGADEANKRMNNLFARKYFIAALTNESQIVQIVLSGGTANYRQEEDGDGSTVAFTCDYTPTSTPIVAINGEVQTSGYSYSAGTVTFSTAPAATDKITIEYNYTVS